MNNSKQYEQLIELAKVPEKDVSRLLFMLEEE
jgi:hypothetical protein